MRLGLLTAALPMLTLDEIAPWAAESGYQMLEIACWPAGGPSRRYAGVSHIDCETIDAAKAREIRATIAASGLDISSLAYYPNPLDPDPAVSAAAFAHIKRVIDAAVLLDVEIVGTFIGADPKKGSSENLETFAKVWPPIIAYAKERGVKIAIENCPMLWADTWPGGTNLAATPAVWKRMFEIIPSDNFGLNYDPSHLVWQFIDNVRPIHEFRDRIFHVHAKDMRVDRDLLYEDGVLGVGIRWAIPKLPGLGDVNWNAFVSALYEVGYDFVISVEHEDRSFEGTEDAVKRGFYLTRDILKPLIH
jgi:sugar phosphate isomerase/epimerase